MMTLRPLLLSAVVAAGIITTPVAATAGLSQCYTSHMCAWGNNDYNWLIARQQHGNSAYVDVFNDANGENDQTDSWANKSAQYTGCLRDNFDGTGNSMTMHQLGQDPNVSVFNSDMVSVMRTAGGC